MWVWIAEHSGTIINLARLVVAILALHKPKDK
jgi:hypothetical protein